MEATVVGYFVEILTSARLAAGQLGQDVLVTSSMSTIRGSAWTDPTTAASAKSARPASARVLMDDLLSLVFLILNPDIKVYHGVRMQGERISPDSGGIRNRANGR